MPVQVGYVNRPLAERYWEKVERRGPDDCWPWRGADDTHGYGIIWIGGERGGTCRAHRVSWFLATGEWPPDDLLVCHTCDNPPCQNHAHHFLGTHKANSDDCAAKNRMGDRGWPKGRPRPSTAGDLNHLRQHPERVLRGEQNGHSKIDAATVLAIRHRLIADSRRGVKTKLAREYGLALSTISDIAHRKRWKHVM